MAGKGGKRVGAGRKSKASKLLEAGFSAAYFDTKEQEKLWKSMLTSKDERIQLDAAKYLTDRLYGKARQGVDMAHTGKVTLEQLVAGG